MPKDKMVNPEGPMTRKGKMDRGAGYRQPADSNAGGGADSRDASERGAYGDFSHMGGRGVHAYPAKESVYSEGERGNRYEEMNSSAESKSMKAMKANRGGSGSTHQGHGPN